MTLRRGRVTALLVPATLYFVSCFHRVAPAAVAEDLMRAFAIGAAALGQLAAVYPYVFAAMALVAGSLADTLGPRWTMAMGGVAMGLGAALFGAAPTFEVAVAGRLLVGVGASVILISWLSLAAAWFRPEEFGRVSGFTQAVGNVGALLASAPLALLVETAGWRHAFALIGAATVGLAVLAGTLVRDRPVVLGLPAVNPKDADRRRPGARQTLDGIAGVVRNPRTWPPILVAGGVYMGIITFMGLWGIPYLMHVHGLRRVEAAGLTALAALGLCVGSPLVGWLSDRWLGRRRLPMVVFTLLFTAGWAPLLLSPAARPAASTLAPFIFLLGLGASGMVLVWPVVREVNDPARVGIAVGFVNMPIFLGFAVMQWLTGVVLDAHWDGLATAGARVYPPGAYRAIFAMCFALALGALIASWFVTETRCRGVWQAGSESP